VGVAITVCAVLSQYIVPYQWPSTRVLYGNLPGDLFIVYGVPVLAFLFLVGIGPLRHWRDHLLRATWEGLRWYGALSCLGFGVVVVALIVYQVVDPSAIGLYHRTNPALQAAERDPWLYVGLSFVVGAFEETIFRGWVFGFWSGRSGPWFVPATWTSAVFAGVHLYYGLTYTALSPIYYSSLFLLGFSFAAVYRFSGGNLLVPALLHGVHDAGAYLTVIPGIAWAAYLVEYVPILVGALIALIVYLEEGPARPPAGSDAAPRSFPRAETAMRGGEPSTGPPGPRPPSA
jgi:membrane protease YdiL (CAAX protease family)